MSSRLWQCPVKGTDPQEAVLAGCFAPQGTGTPIVKSYSNGKFTVARASTGVYVVTLFGATGFIMNNRSSIQIDPAAADLNLQVVSGPISNVGGRVTLTYYVQDTTTGALTDIVQPGSPTAQGSAIHFHFQISARGAVTSGSTF